MPVPQDDDDHDGKIPRVQLAWGRRGARAATAVHHGALIYSCSPDEALVTALAERVGGEVARHSASPSLLSSTPTRFSLAPRSYLGIEPGTHVVLPSPNGSTCCQYGARAAALFVGALVNSKAVASARCACWAVLASRSALSSRTPTSRCRSATAGRRVRARESPPGAGRAATGTRVAPRSRLVLSPRQHVRP